MRIEENVILAPYTTFKIGGPARYFCQVTDEFDALQAFDFARSKKINTLILGGGSNLLISDKGFYGLVIKIANKGIEVLSRKNHEILLKVASGENWDEVVSFAVNNNWWGIENLSHIPGSTGAIAVQNVGAYGQEASEVIKSILAFDKNTGQIASLSNSDCGFAYRQSIFNTLFKNRYIIFNITFKLSPHPTPVLNYADLKQKFPNGTADIRLIRKAIIEIRNKKFPFPVKPKNGNAGSFFKNLLTDYQAYKKLKSLIENKFGKEAAETLEAKKIENGTQIKIPTAFIIDLCDLKELKFGGASINKNQPLVIINKTGEATSSDVLALAEKVKAMVYEKTGLVLQYEPELIGF